jgi:ABC-type Fe3+-siderophore transport system permease subunit
MITIMAGLLKQRPILGISAGFGAGLSALLAFLKVISVVFGAAGAVIGCAAAIYTFANQRREWKANKGK